jgi:hypothetical protein
MSPTQIQKDIKQKLNHLSDNEKMVVLNYLLEELDRPDPEIDRQWAKEALRRQKEMRSGKTKALSHDEVFKKYKK